MIEYWTYRSVPLLFGSAPARPADYYFHLNELGRGVYPLAQPRIERRRPDVLIERLRAGERLTRILISTHMLPRLQKAAALKIHSAY